MKNLTIISTFFAVLIALVLIWCLVYFHQNSNVYILDIGNLSENSKQISMIGPQDRLSDKTIEYFNNVIYDYRKIIRFPIYYNFICSKNHLINTTISFRLKKDTNENLDLTFYQEVNSSNYQEIFNGHISGEKNTILSNYSSGWAAMYFSFVANPKENSGRCYIKIDSLEFNETEEDLDLNYIQIEF